jgi:ComEC/Rec2-related protein
MDYAQPGTVSAEAERTERALFGFLTERIYLQVLLLFAAGIALAGQLILPLDFFRVAVLPVSLLLASLSGLHWLWRDSDRLTARLPSALAIILTGFLYCNLAIHQVSQAPLLKHITGEFQSGEARVLSLPKYQKGHLRFLAIITKLEDASAARELGRCQFYLKCEPGYTLSPGDALRFYGSLEEIAPPRNRGQFNYRAYLMQRGTLASAYLPSERSVQILDDSGSQRLAWLTVLRGRLMDSLTEELPKDLQDLAVSVVYGDKITDLNEELEERFRRAGLTHILVASGTQVSLLIMLMALALWRSPRSFDTRGTLISIAQFIVTAGVVAVYAGITGYETSIVRALCMGVLLCAGRLFLRNVDGLSTLAQAGLILLLAQPLQLFTPGFQLSFLATFGLIYVMGTLHPLIVNHSGWRRFLLDGLLTTGGAQLFVTPVLAASFNQFSLVGLLSNLLAVPLSLLLLICGALASFGLGKLPLLGPALNWLVFVFSYLLDRLASLFGNLSFSSIAVPAPPVWFLLAFYALALLAGEWFRNRDRLSQWQLRRLQPATLCLAWILFAWIAGQLILPHPELSLLRLERSFAIYLDQPGTGRYLVVDPYWLERRHNADNLQSALKARGVSTLSAVYWLGQMPNDNPLQLLSRQQLELADVPSGELPFALMRDVANGSYGMSCSVGRATAALLWDKPAADAPELPRDCSLLLCVPRYGAEDLMHALPAMRREAQLGQGQVWLSLDSLEERTAGWVLQSDAEISIKPAPGDRLSSFTLKR